MRVSIKFIFSVCLVILCSRINQSIAQPNRTLQLLDSGFIYLNAPFKSCHASTIVDLPNNKSLVAWFGGNHEGDKKVTIWSSFHSNNKWSSPIEIANGIQSNGQQFSCWNPVLFRTKAGKLFLFYKVGPNPREWWGEMKVSNNNGLTWSTAEKLPKDFLGPIKNKPIQLSDGSILHPSSTESVADNQWKIHLEKSDRNGKNWKKISINCDTFQVIQPSILTHKDGRLQLLCRSKHNAIVESWSADGGNTWSRLNKMQLPNPNSGSDAVTLSNSLQVLVYNPLPKGEEWWQGRAVLKVAISDDGKNWKDVFTLEQHAEGEYSYPAIIQSSSCNIFITYTYERKRIKYARLSLLR